MDLGRASGSWASQLQHSSLLCKIRKEKKGKVTEPGMTLSLSVCSRGQLEFLESFLLDTSLLNSETFLLIYSTMWSWKRLWPHVTVSSMRRGIGAVLFIAVSPAPKAMPGSY